MAIRIIEGVPGSGKSYYAVKHLADRYFEKQADGRYELIKPVTIITNIDSFQPDHLSLQTLAKDAGGISEFFTEHYQKAITECIGGQIVYIIDEAQKYFRKGDRGLSDVYSYFEYHRHYGHDVYLITQNARKLPPDISCLTEYLIVAAPRTRSVIGEFKYKWLSDGEILKREGFRPDQGIFALYKSMDQKEAEKISNPVMKTAGLALLAVLLVMGGGVYYFKVKWLGSASSSSASSAAPSSSSSLQPTASSAVSLHAKNLVTVPVSVLQEIFNSGGLLRTRQLFVVDGKLLQKADFPYTVNRVAGQWLASVPPDIAILLRPAADKEAEGRKAPGSRRNDSASGSAHGNQEPSES